MSVFFAGLWLYYFFTVDLRKVAATWKRKCLYEFLII
jgi:hypothetical protein